jgi:DNA-binding CsgD family transcriptional regulator
VSAEERSEQVIGREKEFAALEAFLAGDCSRRTLVLVGGPGVGKTTLWDAGSQSARERGRRLLTARPSGAETQFAYSALVDLLDDVGADDLSGLAAPQRRALEAAILRAEPADTRPEPSAIAVGFLNAVRAVAARTPVLVAVDDVQWLDPPSADALSYTARRLEDEDVRFLLAKRPAKASAFEHALERSGVELLEVGPLSLGATRRLLSVRLGLALPRRLLRRLFESSQGNAMFALELGRTLLGGKLPQLGEEIPFPDTLEEVIGTRVTALSPETGRALLAVALSPDGLRQPQLKSLVEPDAIEELVDAGVLVVEGDRVRPAHPLLAAAAVRHSRPHQRAALHHSLAGVMGDEVRRARHLAAAVTAPDGDVAAVIASAATVADARGARHEAAELAEHALRLTPREQLEHSDRLLTLAEYLAKAGELRRVTELLEPEIGALPRGLPRARAWLLLSDGAGAATEEEYLRYLDRALAEDEGDAGLRAMVLARRANNAAAVHVAHLADAEAWALEALVNAGHAGPDVEQLARYALAWVRCLRGRPIDDLLDRSADRGEVRHLRSSLERVACDRLAWRGRLTEARALVGPLLSLAEERGESRSYFALLSQLCEIELRAGDVDLASQLLDEWEQASSDRFVAPVYERCRLVAAVLRGVPAEIERWADDVLARSEMLGTGWDLLEGLRASGIADLFARRLEPAAASLHRVWDYTVQEGIEDPGAFPVAPDLVEALAELGELDEARTVANRLRELAERQQHPWGLATARRCDALVTLAGSAFDERAAEALTEAAEAYGALGIRFDHARCLFSRGRAERRFRKWGAARASLEGAAESFDRTGATGWAAAARSELARVGARRPRPAGELTEAEQRVVELAVQGLSNKEIAGSLVVTVPTVEAHLSRAYRKLGVRSRTQLAARLATLT